jgi:hypothetical protein
MSSAIRFAILAIVPTFSGLVAVADDDPPARSLAEAVKSFNEQAKTEIFVGRNQPPLTEEEVVAAIRGWIRKQAPVDNDTYAIYEKIASTKMLPARATITFTTRWEGYNGYNFDVWWIDLSVMTGETTGYGFRIRDRKIDSFYAGKAAN